jgi:hypothetical protein
MQLEHNIDEEWTQFILNYNKVDNDNDNNNNNNDLNENDVVEHNIDDLLYTNDNNNFEINYDYQIPESTEIYISTKSKIAYLNMPIDLKIFWDIPIMPFTTAKDGVIKKQMKFVSTTEEEIKEIEDNLKKELYYEQYIMSHIDNPTGRIKYKDIRKVSIGISKKDIMSYRTKKKQAFFNCFVMIIRLKINDYYKEFHIKVFNTGKLEIPGIQNDTIYDIVLDNIINILQPYIKDELTYKPISDTVLINSNFNCGFYINREELFEILKYKYNIHAIYDPCSYPGIQCKFYYNKELTEQNGIQNFGEKKNGIIEVSFMIFRTGSVLIVGMCEEYILIDIYNFLKKLFKNEFNKICYQIINKSNLNTKNKKKKIRKRVITIYDTNDIII